MRGDGVYLEAPSRTQELLNIKWTLLSAGFRIKSTWHEGQGSTSSLSSKDHWNAKGVESYTLVIHWLSSAGRTIKAAPEMAMMAGLALARGLQVVCIGPLVGGLNAFRAVRQFNKLRDYEKQILQRMYSQSVLTAERLAA
jgi:hypothetical protein